MVINCGEAVRQRKGGLASRSSNLWDGQCMGELKEDRGYFVRFVCSHPLWCPFLSLLVSVGVSPSGIGAGRRYLPDRNIRLALRQTGGHGDLFAFELPICL